MTRQLRILPYLACVLMILTASGATGDLLPFAFGLTEGDVKESVGDDEALVEFTGLFDYFGDQYTSLHVNTNGVLSFGEAYDEHNEREDPGFVPLLTPFWDDIKLPGAVNGAVFHRDSASAADILLADAYLEALIGQSRPNVDRVIVVTWSNVQKIGQDLPFDLPNTFQAVLISGSDGSLFSVFNYQEINWGQNDAVVAFDKGDGGNIVLLSLSKDLADATICTNVNEPGTVVVRVDEATIQNPSLTCGGPNPEPELDPFSCTVSSTGEMAGFDGTNQQLQSKANNVLTSAIWGQDPDVCRFNVEAKVDKKGNFKHVAISVGLHSNQVDFARTFKLKKNGDIEEHSPADSGSDSSRHEYGRSKSADSGSDSSRHENGLSKRSASESSQSSDQLSLPLSWDDGQTFIVISEEESESVTLASEECGYSFTYTPSATETVFEAVVENDPSNLPTTSGLCGAAI